MIEIDDVSASYVQGRTTIEPLCGVNAVVPSGVLAALTGPSGSGKSTLLRIAAGLQQPTSGQVFVDGEAVKSAAKNAGDPRVSLVHQDYRLIEFLTVAENLRLCAEVHGINLTGDDVGATLATVGLTGFGDRQPSTLSGGEQQRIAIARSLVSGADVVLADEPSGALDAENTDVITNLLLALATEFGKTVLIATHDLTVASRASLRLRLIDGSVQTETRSPV